jgi:hypothetical protein
MAGIARGANRLKIQIIISGMAASAVNALMNTNQRKPTLLMNQFYIFNNPGIEGMTSITIKSYSILMYICMAGETVRLRFRKHETFMTGPAVNYLVLACKFKVSLIMIKLNLILFNFPGCGFMT